ncbi:NADPH:quinone reductase [Actinocatenispora thailandica]|uniref:NADPH:quinone reductase n=1 Tax=Actinocatenispora thailandica TaxID=227318 RepID=A0A7R7HVR9_9ACTN|nr:zinc-binding dehydrogenase [Actinocatenispora thailandica]BCJ33184.1 NADPH:quinone reductase [Actinocatenispora thailandica]
MLVAEAVRFGGPDVLVGREAPEPVAGPGQVVLDVAAIDVLYVETQVRSGWGREWFPVTPPYVPGDGVAGTVTAVGDDVASDWLGRRVVGYTGSANAYAQRANVAVDQLAPVPDGLDLVDAAALSHDGPMALTLLSTAAVRAGEAVLVLGANGGAGLLAVQLVAAAGARVFGAARGERKQDLVRQAGAESVLDPSEPGWPARLRDAGGVDVVFDGVGGDIGTAGFDAVRRGGRFLSYGAPTGGFADIAAARAAERDVTRYGIAELSQARNEVTSLAAQAFQAAIEGRLRPAIGRVFGLRDAAAAHAAIESRAVLGKILLQP